MTSDPDSVDDEGIAALAGALLAFAAWLDDFLVAYKEVLTLRPEGKDADKEPLKQTRRQIALLYLLYARSGPLRRADVPMFLGLPTRNLAYTVVPAEKAGLIVDIGGHLHLTAKGRSYCRVLETELGSYVARRLDGLHRRGDRRQLGEALAVMARLVGGPE